MCSRRASGSATEAPLSDLASPVGFRRLDVHNRRVPKEVPILAGRSRWPRIQRWEVWEQAAEGRSGDLALTAFERLSDVAYFLRGLLRQHVLAIFEPVVDVYEYCKGQLCWQMRLTGKVYHGRPTFPLYVYYSDQVANDVMKCAATGRTGS